MNKQVIYDLSGESQITKSRIKKKWGAYRLFKKLITKFPPIGESVLLNHVLRYLHESGVKLTEKHIYRLRKSIIKDYKIDFRFGKLPSGRYQVVDEITK